MKPRYFIFGIIAAFSIAALSLYAVKLDSPYVGSCNGETRMMIALGQSVMIRCMGRDSVGVIIYGDAEIINKGVKK